MARTNKKGGNTANMKGWESGNKLPDGRPGSSAFQGMDTGLLQATKGSHVRDSGNLIKAKGKTDRFNVVAEHINQAKDAISELALNMVAPGAGDIIKDDDENKDENKNDDANNEEVEGNFQKFTDLFQPGGN